MQSRLISALVAGALALAVAAPAMAADNTPATTTINVEVSAGTTLVAPASYDLSGYPGQAVNDTEAVGYYTNEDQMVITVDVGDVTCQDASCGFGTTPDVILDDNVFVTTADTSNLSMASVRDVNEMVENQYSEQTENVRFDLTIPSVRVGTYSGTVTFDLRTLN